MLALLGVASGLFFVPLNAYLQQRSESREKGRIIATNNFYNTHRACCWPPRCSVAAARPAARQPAAHHPAASASSPWRSRSTSSRWCDDFLIRFLLWLLTHTIFRIRIVGQENVPFRGPALLVSNHMSHVDGFLVGACVQRFIRFMVWKPYYELKALNWFFRKTNADPGGHGGRATRCEAIRAARQELAAGHVVCIFAEGAISRTGNMLPFKRGMEKIVDGLDVPIIPVHLDRLWGSIFSFERGRFFWKWPKRIPYPVTVSFGASDAGHVPPRMTCGRPSRNWRRKPPRIARPPAIAGPRRVIRSARRNWSHFAMADSTGRELTYGRMLTGSVAGRGLGAPRGAARR